MTKAFGDFLAQRIRPQCLERRIRAGAFIVIQALDDSIRIGAIEQTRRFVVLGCRQPSVGTEFDSVVCLAPPLKESPQG